MTSSECRCAHFCGFFESRDPRLGPAETELRARLCDQGGHRCARQVVFAIAGEHAVPADLFPDDLPSAMRLIETYWSDTPHLPPTA